MADEFCIWEDHDSLVQAAARFPVTRASLERFSIEGPPPVSMLDV